MDLTYAVLYDLLKHEYPLLTVPEDAQHRVIREILLWTGENRNNHALYLATVPPESDEENVLTISPLPARGWWLPVAQDQVFPTISRILQIGQQYMSWCHRCRILAEAEHDIQTLMDLTTEYLQIQMMFIDRGYVLREHSRYPQLPWESEEPVMPRQALEELYSNNPEFDKTFHQHGLLPYPQYPTPGFDFYYYNVHYENFYLGRLLVTIPQERRGDGILQLMEALCALCSGCYQHIYLHQNRYQAVDQLLVLWRRMLQGEDLGQEDAEAVLRKYGWEPSDRYRVMQFVPHGYFYSEQTMVFYANQLESQFPACIAVQSEGKLLVLHNLDRDQCPDFRQELSAFLRENLFRVGISNSFRDFFSALRYRDQAEDALRFGTQRNPDLWRYDFSDYVSDCTLFQCMARYPARDLCPANLRALLEFDEAHPDIALFETLKQYYACQFNAQLAAQRLFIHRTTFFYRLNKIRKIASFHPDNPTEVFQILLAFAALEREESTNS